MIYLRKILFQSKTCSHVSITNTVQIITIDILQTIKPVPLQNQWLTDILQTIKPVPSQNQWFTTQPIHIHFDFKLSVLVNTHLSTNKQHTNKHTKNMEPSKCLSNQQTSQPANQGYSKRDLKHKRLSSKIAGYIDFFFFKGLTEGADGVKYAMPLPCL